MKSAAERQAERDREARLREGLPVDPDGLVRTGKAGRPLKPVKHATYAGYKQEVRRGLPPCRFCRDARRAYDRRLDAARRKGR